MREALQNFNSPHITAEGKQKFLNKMGEFQKKKDFGFIVAEFFQQSRGWDSKVISLA